MKKICLIIPPSPFLLDEKVFPFIGILKVASSFEQQGAECDVLDLGGIKNYQDVLEDYLKQNNNLEFIGITATTPQMPFAFNLGAQIKQFNKNIKTVLGGSHCTLMHTAAKTEQKKGLRQRSSEDVERLKQNFDILVCGDGELVLDEIRKMETGVIDVDDRFSPFFLSNEKFSDLPSPARHLIDLDSYHYSIEGYKSTSLIAQLGCPFRCTFCSGRSSPYLRMIRNRSVQSIIEELRFLNKAYGYTGFMFYDDELNVSKSMVELMDSITELQKELKTEFRLRGFVKAELFNEQQAKAMFDAGFRWLLCGYESGDARILKNIEKQATREDNTKCVEIAKKYGLKVKALMSIGHAGETEETITNTKNWLLEVKPDDFDCTIITTYPGSPYYDFATKNDDGSYTYVQPKTGDKLYQANLDYTQKSDYYKGIPGEYVSYVWTDFLKGEDLIRLRDNLENEVRTKLNIPFNPGAPGIKYEHSMGQGNIPSTILRNSKDFKEIEVEQPKEKVKLVVIK